VQAVVRRNLDARVVLDKYFAFTMVKIEVQSQLQHTKHLSIP